MILRRIIFLVTVMLSVLAMGAQTAFPPKNFPAVIPFRANTEVSEIWKIRSMVCQGETYPGYRFKIHGQGMKDSPSRAVEIYYVVSKDSIERAGTYIFPSVRKGEDFSFDIVSAEYDSRPNNFLGFLFKSLVPEEPLVEDIEVVVKEAPKSEERAIKEDNKVFVAVEQMPEYPGGTAAMYRFIGNHLVYPSLAVENNIQGRVMVGFVVGKDGSVEQVKVVRGKHPLLDAEAIRVVKSMPKWIPGKNNGCPVRVSMTIPINFKLMK